MISGNPHFRITNQWISLPLLNMKVLFLYTYNTFLELKFFCLTFMTLWQKLSIIKIYTDHFKISNYYSTNIIAKDIFKNKRYETRKNSSFCLDQNKLINSNSTFLKIEVPPYTTNTHTHTNKKIYMLKKKLILVNIKLAVSLLVFPFEHKSFCWHMISMTFNYQPFH